MIQVIHTINGATATTTGATIDAEGAKRISLVFKRSNHSSGSTTFTVDVSVDGSAWIDYNKLISNAANTNAQTLTRVASVALSSDTSVFYTMDPDDCFKYMRVVATEATDGTHDAWVILDLCD